MRRIPLALFLAAACAMLASPAQASPLRPKVLVLSYDPIIDSEGARRLHQVCRWNDPRLLCANYIKDIRECSGGYVQYRVAEWHDLDETPVKQDGFRYTDESYMACFRKEAKWHQPDGVDYRAIIERFRLPERVERGEIDEVWLFGPPYGGFWESTMVGDRAYFCNSDPVPGVKCKRNFVIMGFNYERGVGEMLEDLGHRTESILHHVYGSWEAKETHAWNRFTLHERDAPGKSGCGNIHFAPNSARDYDWGNKRPVASTCDDWLAYPKLAGKTRTVTCEEWGNGDIRLHHKWWFRHLPHAPGRGPDGRLNNWWSYVVDMNRYRESRQ